MEVKSKLDERFKDVKNCYEIGIWDRAVLLCGKDGW